MPWRTWSSPSLRRNQIPSPTWQNSVQINCYRSAFSKPELRSGVRAPWEWVQRSSRSSIRHKQVRTHRSTSAHTWSQTRLTVLRHKCSRMEHEFGLAKKYSHLTPRSPRDSTRHSGSLSTFPPPASQAAGPRTLSRSSRVVAEKGRHDWALNLRSSNRHPFSILLQIDSSTGLLLY